MRHTDEGVIPGIASPLLDPRALPMQLGEYDLLDSAGNPQCPALLLHPATIGTRFRSQLMIDMSAGDFTRMEA